MKKIKFIILALSILVVALPMSVYATPTYEGFLTGSGGLYATDGWASEETNLSWKVYAPTNPENTSGFWLYKYTFTVPTKNISHMIFEVSDSFSENNIKEGSDYPVLDIYSSTSQGNSNPYMPGEFQGIKWGPGELTLSATLVTDKNPVWGDFYAKDGKDQGVLVYAYNKGFTADDVDPTDAPSNGSINNHVLAPDTGTPPIPEPGTLLLIGFGLVGIAGYSKFALARKKR